MGYHLAIKPKDNFEKYRTVKSPMFDDLILYKEQYLYYRCMKPNCTKKDEIQSFMYDLKYYIDELARHYAENRKAELTGFFDYDDVYDPKGEICFSGWKYSKREYVELEDKKVYIFKKLFNIALLSKSVDFMEEGEKFFEKSNEIWETLNYLKETVEDDVDFDVIDYYIINEEKKKEEEKKEDERCVVSDDIEDKKENSEDSYAEDDDVHQPICIPEESTLQQESEACAVD